MASTEPFVGMHLSPASLCPILILSLPFYKCKYQEKPPVNALHTVLVSDSASRETSSWSDLFKHRPNCVDFPFKILQWLPTALRIKFNLLPRLARLQISTGQQKYNVHCICMQCILKSKKKQKTGEIISILPTIQKNTILTNNRHKCEYLTFFFFILGL